MSDQDKLLIETTVSLEQSNDQHLPANNDTDSKPPIEQGSSRRITMSQDIRYSTEQTDRDKLLIKYNAYQLSDINACNIRFLIDHRQKKRLFGHSEGEEEETLQSLTKTFDVNVFPGYQQSTKHSYKIFGTEVNVQRCLMEIMNRMFKQSNRSSQRHPHDKQEESACEISQTTDQGKDNVDDKSCSHPTSIFITTINPDSSITEETKPITATTPNTNEEKIEKEELKFVPVQRKPEYTFIMLISSAGQEVLKKHWSFFAGTLQQRLNVIVANPVRLPKFGDKQVHNELSITGASLENLVDATLQMTAFINDVLGIPIEPYQANEERTDAENNETQCRESNKYNQRASSSTANNYSERTFVNRNRSETLEQRLLIRSDCVSRIVGKRGSNLKLIKSKCHLRDIIIERQANENGYTECTLSAYQPRNLQSAMDTIRSFLRNEDQSAVLVIESNHDDIPSQESSGSVSSTPLSNVPPSQGETGSGFTTKSFHLGTGNSYPQSSYIFQNTPSFDFTHQATAASRKTDKRPGDLTDNSPHLHTPSESHDQHHVHSLSSTSSSISPRHQSKRTCPETKDIHCITDDGFWIQKQYYHALDENAKEQFDSLMEKLEQIRLDTEENAARKQQRLAGRNRSTKSRVYTSSISYLNEENNRSDKDLMIKPVQNENNIKIEQATDNSEEKENQQEIASVIVQQN